LKAKTLYTPCRVFAIVGGLRRRFHCGWFERWLCRR